jgi:hypothetical protein
MVNRLELLKLALEIVLLAIEIYFLLESKKIGKKTEPPSLDD